MNRAAAAIETDGAAIDLRTVFGILQGRRESILRAARARATIWIGACFVLAAGLARNYDAHDLTREPWWLLIPYAVSATLGLAVYSLARVRTAERPRFWAGYRALLGVMWLMAPTALLYGIPWERMVSPADAVSANLWTLALASVWRVSLMARVVSVLAGLPGVAAFFRVMLIAGTAGFAALLAVPKPIFYFMGGIQQTQGERLIASLALLAVPISGMLMFVWIVGGVIAMGVKSGQWRIDSAGGARISSAVMILAAIYTAPWLVALPGTQSEQRLRYDVERAMREGRIDAALAVMSAHDRRAFPPQWEPPPKVGWDVAEVPPVLDVMERIVQRGEATADWVRAIYVDKFERHYMTAWWTQDAEWPRAQRVLAQMRERDELTQRHAEWLRRWHPEEATTTTTTTPATNNGPSATAPAITQGGSP
jgi:hypothetical protein